MLVGCPKSEHGYLEHKDVRISALFGYRTFGFRTEKTVWNPNKNVRISALFTTESYLQPNRIDL